MPAKPNILLITDDQHRWNFFDNRHVPVDAPTQPDSTPSPRRRGGGCERPASRREGRRTWSGAVAWSVVVVGCLAWMAFTAHAEPVATARYELQRPGDVSAAVYDDRGTLLRTLLRGQPQGAGEHTLRWDGLDREGRPQPPGDYALRVLSTPGFTVEFLFQLGVRPTTAPYHSWAGNHGGVAALAVDDTGLYIGAAISESPPGVIKQSLDGRERLWSQRVKPSTNGPVALSSNGQGTLYWLRYDGKLKIVDADTGKGGEELFGGIRSQRMDWDLLHADAERPKSHRQPVAVDLAALGETVAATYRDHDMLRWLDPDSGDVVASRAVTRPGSVALIDPNVALVISDGASIRRITRDGGDEPVVAGLNNARHVAVDRTRGHVLVATGAPEHQVHRYTLEGRRVGSYGRAGGRAQGVYEPRDFLSVADLVSDQRGGFVVAEADVAEGDAAPRRTVHLDEDGEVIHEWPGPHRFRGAEFVDPEQPSNVWYTAGDWLVLAEVDYEAKTWRIAETYKLSDLAEGLIPPSPKSSSWRVTYHEGERYLVSGTPLPRVLHHERGRLQPRVAAGKLNKAQQQRLAALIDRDPGPFESYFWTDRNRDGRVEAAEVVLSEVQSSSWSSCGVGPDLSIAYLHNEKTADGVRNTLRRLRVQRWDQGVPIYDITQPLGERLSEAPPEHRAGRGDVYVAEDGSIYGIYNWGQRHGEFFPSDKSGAHNRLAAWSSDGTLRFSVGRHDALTNTRFYDTRKPPGWFHAPYDIPGSVHGCVVVTDFMETPAMAWTHDGLYVGHFLANRVDDGLPGTVYHWWRDPDTQEISLINRDSGSRSVVFQRDNGEVIWIAPGKNSAPVYRVHGWDNWQRLEQSITLTRTPQHAAKQGQGLRGDYFHGSSFAGEPELQRIDPRLWFGVGWRSGGDKIIDGLPRPPRSWADGPEGLDRATDFAVRWTGDIEAPLSETFVFSTYLRGRVRLWVDGRQLLYGWNATRQRRLSEPIELRAGERYRIQLDYHTIDQHPALSLNWESDSLDRVRVPMEFLYPPETLRAPLEPQPRDATQRIEAETFDEVRGEVRWKDFVWGRNVRRNVVGLSNPGDYLRYDRLDFGEGVDEVSIASRHPSTDLTLRLDTPDGPVLATLRGGGGLDAERIDVAETSGVHDVYLVNETGGNVALRHFSFR